MNRKHRPVHVDKQGRQVQHHQGFRASAQRVLQEVRQLERLIVSGSACLAITAEDHLGIPARDMLVTLPISFLAQRRDDIPKGVQTLADALRLFHFAIVNSTHLKQF